MSDPGSGIITFTDERAELFAESCTLVLMVGYRGAGFCGFAEQASVRTVAGEIRHALETVFRRPVELSCAGRTDAGVHALAQYVSMPLTRKEYGSHAPRLGRSLTALFPDDISLRALYVAPAGFSARFDALSRTYLYRISDGGARPCLLWDVSWFYGTALDLSAMQSASGYLLGEHDFKSFCKTSSAEGHPTCRCVEEISLGRVCEAGEASIAVTIRANAFLHTMVRTIVGSLVEVGSGRRNPAWMASVLAAKDRRCAGPTAPAKGLTLVEVGYPDALLSQVWPKEPLCLSQARSPEWAVVPPVQSKEPAVVPPVLPQKPKSY